MQPLPPPPSKQDLCWQSQPPRRPAASTSREASVGRGLLPKPSRATARAWACLGRALRKSFRGPRTGPRRVGPCRLVRALASASSQASQAGDQRAPHGICQRGGAADPSSSSHVSTSISVRPRHQTVCPAALLCLTQGKKGG